MSSTDASQAVSRWLADFSKALEARDIPAALALFGPEAYWRDFIAFTWNITTMEGNDAIRAMLESTLARVAPGTWKGDDKASVADGVTQGWFTFETAVGRGKGQVRLKDGKAWTLFTTLQELKGFEVKEGFSRPFGTDHGAFKGRRSWLEKRQQEEAELGYSVQPYCLVIGGGQGGIGLGARLKRIGVPTLVVDQHAHPGDAWRKRYKSLCLHDPVWYDHMPYLPFPDHWPIYTPKDQMGDWLEAYTKLMELNYWSSTSCRSASYDAARKEWTVVVEREGKPVTLRPKQLVLATGMSGVPNMPHYPGADIFKGKQHHSSRHTGGEGFAGKHCVVVGSNNSAHDIAADLWEYGAASVTMLQRSPTLVVKSETLAKFRSLYSEEAVKSGIDADFADLMTASIPYALLPQFLKPVVEQIKKLDADFYEGLRKAGFMLTFGEDETGIGMMYPRRGAGYYIDVGASQLIVDGEIKLKPRAIISRLTETGVVLQDGSELPADLVVYATGYGSMNGWAADLISPAVAEKVGPCWGLGSNTAKDPGPWQGELRNMWKPTAQEALWFHGGNLAQSRHYSRYMALQLKARMEGIPTPVYGPVSNA